MKSRSIALTLILTLCGALSAAAQSPTVGQYSIQKVKPGHGQQYEAGRKRHMAFHKAEKDTWSWVTWEILNGPNGGSYLIGSGGHQWKDFDGRDAFNAKDGADAQMNVVPHVESSTTSYWAFREDLSTAGMATAPPAMVSIIEFHLKPSGVGDFTEAVKKINEAIRQTNYPFRPSRWYSLVSGGDGPRMLLSQERRNWTDMTPPEKSLQAAMVEAYGQAEADKIWKSITDNYTTATTYIMRFRSDLSYIPGN